MRLYLKLNPIRVTLLTLCNYAISELALANRVYYTCQMLVQDTQFALRQLRNHPGFALTAVLTLALGIGATTAIYTLFDQMLLRNLPVEEPTRLVMLHFSGSDTGSLMSRGGSPGDYFSYPMYRNIRNRNSVFSGVLATAQTQVAIQWKNTPAFATSELVSGNYFDVLGVRPVIGRLFSPSDDEFPDRDPIVILSYAFWQREFGGDPKALNQTLRINSHPFTIVGVLQPSFKSVVVGSDPDLFVPMMMKAQITPGWGDLDNPRSRWLQIIARLKQDTSAAQSEAGANVLWKALRAEELKSMSISSQNWIEGFLNNSYLSLIDASKGFSPVRSLLQAPLFIMAGMVALLMVIASANIATLLLLRSAGRIREISVRYALGATRRRITCQMTTEGVILGICGGTLGILIVPWLTSILLHKLFLAKPNAAMSFHSNPDLRVLAFNFVIAIVVGVALSAAPIMQFRRLQISSALKQQLSTLGGGHFRLQRIFTVMQMALSLLLLAAAALMVRSIGNLKSANLGFQTDHLLTFTIQPRFAGYERAQMPSLNKRILDSLASVPEIKSTAATTDAELANHNVSGNITIAGYQTSDNESMVVEWPCVTPDYFATLNMPLLTGRIFDDADRRPDAPRVAIVNQTFARKWLGDAHQAVGRLFAVGSGSVQPDIQIIGVVADSKHTNVRKPAVPTAYLLLDQNPTMIDALTYYVRTTRTPESTMQFVRNAIQTVDSALVLDRFRTMDQQIDTLLATEKVTAFLATSFGVLAALLSAVGLYGVLAYSVTQRTHEIGIRMALGSTRVSVVLMLTNEILKLVGISIAIALPFAFFGARLLGNQLFGIVYPDWLILTQVILLIVSVAIVASLIPALRAARVHPMQALRYE
jgi:putative ABC transport system permease protein